MLTVDVLDSATASLISVLQNSEKRQDFVKFDKLPRQFVKMVEHSFPSFGVHIVHLLIFLLSGYYFVKIPIRLPTSKLAVAQGFAALLWQSSDYRGRGSRWREERHH